MKKLHRNFVSFWAIIKDWFLSAIRFLKRKTRTIPVVSKLLVLIELENFSEFRRLVAVTQMLPSAILFYHDQYGHRGNTKTIRNELDENETIVVEKFLHGNTIDFKHTTFCPLPASALQFVKAPLLVTPYVGSRQQYAPKHTKVLHPLVSLTSLEGVYEDWHFDNYDYIVVAGSHQVESFQRLVVRRPNLRGKFLLPFGYPKLDMAIDESSQLPVFRDEQPWIVYAPTHVNQANECFASLRLYGEAIVDALLNAGIGVRFRPHPVSFKDSDKNLVQRIFQKHKDNPIFCLDQSANYLEVYSKTHMMVTDISGTGFTYAFTFGRPTVFFAHNKEAELGLKGIQFESRERIGAVVRNLSELLISVQEILCLAEESSKTIRQFRDETIYCCGSSGERIARAIRIICENDVEPEWIRL